MEGPDALIRLTGPSTRTAVGRLMMAPFCAWPIMLQSQTHNNKYRGMSDCNPRTKHGLNEG